MNFIRKNYKSIILLLLFIIWTYLVISSNIVGFDLKCYSFISKYITDNNTVILKVLTQFGSSYTLILISLLVLFLSNEEKVKKGVPINLTCAFLVNNIIKNIIRRPRPNVLRLISESGFSFPSGHSMVSTAFYGYLIYLIYNQVNNKFLKYFFIIILSLLILVICLSRVYLGVHYMSDVIGGILLAIYYLIFFIKVSKRLN